MRVVLALDKFKGTFSARQACEQLADGIRHRNPKIELILRPMADGGEGSAAILQATMGLEARRVEVPDLLNRPTEAHVYWQPSRRLVVLESASVLGSTPSLAREEALHISNTKGLGRLLQKALELRPLEIWLGIGGTLTADAGWGLASLFGLIATDAEGASLEPCLANMDKIAHLALSEPSELLKKTKVIALCDVNAPAVGGHVSLSSFLAQKGAQPSSIAEIEKKITTFWGRLRTVAPQLPKLEDAFMGAGGGLCLGLAAVIPNLQIELGSRRIAQAIALGPSLQRADLVVCGEGCLDEQTLYGKAASTVSQIASEHQTRLMGVFGRISGDGAQLCQSLGLSDALCLTTAAQSTLSLPELARVGRSRFHDIGIEIAHRLEVDSGSRKIQS